MHHRRQKKRSKSTINLTVEGYLSKSNTEIKRAIVRKWSPSKLIQTIKKINKKHTQFDPHRQRPCDCNKKELGRNLHEICQKRITGTQKRRRSSTLNAHLSVSGLKRTDGWKTPRNQACVEESAFCIPAAAVHRGGGEGSSITWPHTSFHPQVKLFSAA